MGERIGLLASWVSWLLTHKVVLLSVGGAVGTCARYFVSTWIGVPLWARGFPIGTFVINVTGSLFLGWFLTVIGGRTMVSDNSRLAIATGFVGAYTTFSTFMYESNSLLESGSSIKAMGNLIGSVVVGLIAVRLGIWLGER